MGFYKEHRLSSLWGSIVIIMYNLDERSEVVPGHVHMLSVVDKVAMGQVSLQVLRFSLQYHFTNVTQSPLPSKLLLTQWQLGKAWVPFNKITHPSEIREQLTALLPVFKDVMLLQLLSLNNDSWGPAIMTCRCFQHILALWSKLCPA